MAMLKIQLPNGEWVPIQVVGSENAGKIDQFVQELETHKAENKPHDSIPYAKIIQSATAQSVPNTTLTKVGFQTVEKDNCNMADLTNDALICRVPGVYLLFGGVFFQSNPTGGRAAYVYKNGGLHTTAGASTVPGMSLYVSIAPIRWCINLEKDDYIQIYCHQNSGGAIDLVGNPVGVRTHFGMLRIGG